MIKTSQDRQGTGLSVKAGRGGIRREGNGGRQRERDTLGRENPRCPQVPGHRPRAAKG